jgi:serine/threonine protein kinase
MEPDWCYPLTELLGAARLEFPLPSPVRICTDPITELDGFYLLTVLREVALGIYYLHHCEPPVLHLDLKSANVLLDEAGTAKVGTIEEWGEGC